MRDSTVRVVVGAVPGEFLENAVRVAVRYHQRVQLQSRLLLLIHINNNNHK